ERRPIERKVTDADGRVPVAFLGELISGARRSRKVNLHPTLTLPRGDQRTYRKHFADTHSLQPDAIHTGLLGRQSRDATETLAEVFAIAAAFAHAPQIERRAQHQGRQVEYAVEPQHRVSPACKAVMPRFSEPFVIRSAES